VKKRALWARRGTRYFNTVTGCPGQCDGARGSACVYYCSTYYGRLTIINTKVECCSIRHRMQILYMIIAEVREY